MKNILDKYHSKIDLVSLYVFAYCVMVKALIHVLFFVENEIVLSLLVLLIPFVLISKKNIHHLNSVLHAIFRFRR